MFELLTCDLESSAEGKLFIVEFSDETERTITIIHDSSCDLGCHSRDNIRFEENYVEFDDCCGNVFTIENPPISFVKCLEIISKCMLVLLNQYSSQRNTKTKFIGLFQEECKKQNVTNTYFNFS